MSNLADFHRKFGLNVNYPNYFSVCWSVHLAGISAGKWEMGLKTLIISEYNSLSWLFTGKTEAHIVPANWSPPRIPGGHIVIVSNTEEGEEHGEETAFTFGSVWLVTEQSLRGTNWNWFGCLVTALERWIWLASRCGLVRRSKLWLWHPPPVISSPYPLPFPPQPIFSGFLPRLTHLSLW